MNITFFDTETTGLVKHKLEDTHPDQPMPVQLGVKLDSFDGKEAGAANLLIKPHGRWEISPKASEVTGITNQWADAYGTELETAYEVFADFVAASDVLVAHNFAFDIKVMRRAAMVYSELTGTSYQDPFEGKTCICTMLASIDIVKAAPKRNGQWKWPKLEECVQHFFGESIIGAHDALVDVRATARVFYELRSMGVFEDNLKPNI